MTLGISKESYAGKGVDPSKRLTVGLAEKPREVEDRNVITTAQIVKDMKWLSLDTEILWTKSFLQDQERECPSRFLLDNELLWDSTQWSVI